MFLFGAYFDEFSEEKRAEMVDLYRSQSEVLNRFSAAYEEDTILSVTDLLQDMMSLVECVEEKGLL